MNWQALIEQLREFDSALLANTLGYIDDTPAHELYMGGDIACLTPGLGPTVGLAITGCADTSRPFATADMEPFWQTLELAEAAGCPTVWVVQAIGPRPEHECILGDGMAKLLRASGCVGIVTDGRARDMAGMIDAGFACYGRGAVIHHAALRFSQVNEPVEVGGLTIQADELIHASREGVIRIPVKAAEELVRRAPAMRAFEHDAHAVFRRTDLSLADKRRLAGEALERHGFAPAPTGGEGQPTGDVEI